MKTHEKQLNKWIDQLQADDWQVRWNAAQNLRDVQDERCIAPLLKALQDQSWIVRWEVAETLAQIGDARVIPPLLAMLSGKITYLRAPAAWILGKKKASQAVLPLIQALEDQQWFGRAMTAWALGEIGDWRAVTPLMNACHDLEPGVCDAAETALESMYASMTSVFFGNIAVIRKNSYHGWPNPEAHQIPRPLVSLKRIHLHAATYDFHLVERFLTYAVNSFKAGYLKANVSVEIYGDLAKIYSNLLNNFKYLCKRVNVHAISPKTCSPQSPNR